jgi:hypothetical protein
MNHDCLNITTSGCEHKALVALAGRQGRQGRQESKNRDKQLTIVRVTGWFVIFSLTIRSPVKQSLCLKSIIQDHPIEQNGQHHRCKKAFLYQQIG